MRKLKLSFFSGLIVFVLLIAPFNALVSQATDGNSVRDDVYGDTGNELGVRGEVYEAEDPPTNGTSNDGDSQETSTEDGEENEANDEEPIITEDGRIIVSQVVHGDTEYTRYELNDDNAIAYALRDTVTNDVYYMYRFNEENIKQYITENGGVHLPTFGNTFFTSDLLSTLPSEGEFVFDHNGAWITIPTEAVKGSVEADQEFYISMGESDWFLEEIVTPYSDMLKSKAYDINILRNGNHYDDDGNEMLHNFIERDLQATMTFTIDPATVSDWGNLYLINLYNDFVYSDQIIDVNQNTGEITVALPSYHLGFSDYGYTEELFGTFAIIEAEPDDIYVPLVHQFYSYEELIPYLTGYGEITFKGMEDAYFGEDALVGLTGKDLTFTQGENHIKVPVNSFMNATKGKEFTFSIQKANQSDEFLVSDVLQIKLQQNNHQTQSDLLEEPMLVTFKVDPTSVKNWNNLYLRSYDTPNDYSRGSIVQYNEETGEITAEIYSFGTYGIVELDQIEEEIGKEDEDSIVPPINVNDTGGNTGDINIQIENSANADSVQNATNETFIPSSYKGEKDVSLLKEQTLKGSSIDSTKDYGVGTKTPFYEYYLPRTATDVYNYLIVGVISLLAGLGTFLFMSRREVKEA